MHYMKVLKAIECDNLRGFCTGLRVCVCVCVCVEDVCMCVCVCMYVCV